MSKVTGMKSLILATALGLVPLAHAASGPYGELGKEIEIMSGVVDTALKQDMDRQGIRYRGLNASYLAKQGVVFEVSTRDASAGFGAHLSDILHRVPHAPMPPVTIIGGGGDFEIQVEDEWEELAEDTVRRVEHAFRETREEIRELRSDERELKWEKRDLERRKRDLEFEARQADGDRAERIRENLKELEQELAQLATREQELSAYAEKVEKEQQEKLNQQKQAQEKAYRQFLANFESNIGSALCRFGAGLRGLPENEHISFVLKDFAHGEDTKRQDRVYVFTKANVKSCVQEKTDAQELLAQATVYQF